MPSNARQQFLRIWPGIDVPKKVPLFDPKVDLFENSLLKILAQLDCTILGHTFRAFLLKHVKNNSKIDALPKYCKNSQEHSPIVYNVESLYIQNIILF